MSDNTPVHIGDFNQDSTIETPHGRVQYDSSLEGYRLQHDWTTNHSLSTTVLFVIEAASEQSIDELTPLHEAIDPDGLDKLFIPLQSGKSRTRGQVTFPYAGFRVTIAADGTITVRSVHSTDETP